MFHIYMPMCTHPTSFLSPHKNRSGIRTVPQIFVGDSFFGGNDKVVTLELDGTLRQALVKMGARGSG
jgi:glutaredoxin-related protein